MFKDLFRLVNNAINSSALAIIVPVLFIILLFVGSNFCKSKQWNEDYLDKTQTNIIKGFCAVGIILHHLSQETAAPWLNSKYIIHGLDFFVNIGYLFVGAFLFISGYGLYKSLKAKQDYFQNYFSRRILPLLIAYATTQLIYYLYDTTPSTYNWYIVAIILCYILFYIGFKFFKNEIISFAIIIVGIVAYSAYCSFMMLGGWWYNTVGLFAIGLAYAKYEKYIISFFKKTYIPLLLISIVLTCICTWYGRYYENVVYSVTKESLYNLYSLYIILFRFVAAINFSLALILVSLKCKFKNKVLSFYGSISLEFYLIQGLFVQAFSYSYFDVASKTIYYIKNIPLYMLVVISLSTICGFILNFVDKKIMEFFSYFYEKRKNEIKYVWKALKTLFKVMGIVLVVYLLFLGVKGYKQDKGYKQAIETYKEKYIDFVDVYGKNMAAYVVGQGKDTIVLMRGNDDPCPTLSMRFLADKLSEDYKVVELDYLGTGFSDEPTTVRTSKNIAKEIHEALKNLGITDKYILMPQYISGVYAQEYCKLYKNEVKGVIAIESEVFAERKALISYNGVSNVEYYKHMRVNVAKNYLLGKLRYIKGIDTLIWPIVKEFYTHGLEEDELIVARKMFFKNIYNSTYWNEHMHEMENINNSLSAQYPREIYVYDILGHYESLAVSRMGYSASELHAQSCFNRSKYKYKEVNDVYNCFFYGPGIIKKITDEAVELMK